MQICPKCNAENESGHKFCCMCGTLLPEEQIEMQADVEKKENVSVIDGSFCPKSIGACCP